MTKRLGESVIRLDTPPSVLGFAAVAGKKEGEGPLGNWFDVVNSDATFGQTTWEKAETQLQKESFACAIGKSGKCEQDIQCLFAGDLMNQCIASAFAFRDRPFPFVGLYGACSTMAESLMLASLMIDGGFADCTAAVTSSHFCSAEKQYRFPLEYGGQRPPTAQWTVTGAGAFLVGSPEDHPDGVRITAGMPGKAQDYGINDANNMGAAMAPAARDTLHRYFASTGASPKDYDKIVTGDLGFEGGSILCELMRADGIELSERYADCGQMIYHKKEQDVHGGGSGCGCAASVLAAHVLPTLRSGEWKRILFLATGAMMSPDLIKQGENIPSIAHLIELESPVLHRERS